MFTRQVVGLCNARSQRNTVSCRALAVLQSKKRLLMDRKRRKVRGLGRVREEAIVSGLNTFAI